uniref:Ig-like domain-containing protein n=1 Tax=Biomphalaria glabrata TaxID=6526 RepID=A0A2C9LUX5_BIOGL
MTLYLIFLTLSTILNEIDTSTIRHCPVANVGESYELHCSGRTSNEGRFIVWNQENIENRTNEELGHCYLNSTCFTQNTSRYHVNLTLQYSLKLFLTFDSVLTISNVTENDRDTVMSCGVVYETWLLSEPEILMACRLPVFDLTPLPSCRAKLFMPDVSIVCDFQRVYPTVTCLLGYESNVFQPEVPVDYVKAPTPASPGYYDISCKGFLKFKDRYQTTYYVRMLYTYEFDIKEGENITQSRVQEVTLKWSPQTVINSPPYISICPPNMSKNVTVYCSATSSSKNVKLNLFVDNVKVIPQKLPTQSDCELYITMQEYILEVDTLFQNKSLSCQREGFSNDTANIDVLVPPTSNPLFGLGERIGINHINIIPEDAKLFITCQVNGGVPLVNNISVVCFLFNGTRLLTIHNFSNFVYFTIHGKSFSLGSYCICSAHHVSGCYTKNALLRISVDSFNENVVQSGDKSNTSYIIYIAAALVLISLVSVVIAMSAFLWRDSECMHLYCCRTYYSFVTEKYGNSWKFRKDVSASETTDRYRNFNAPPVQPRSILEASGGAETHSAGLDNASRDYLKCTSKESSSGVQTEEDETTDRYKKCDASLLPPRSILKASSAAKIHFADFKYTSEESSSGKQTEKDESHLNENEKIKIDYKCLLSSIETKVKTVDEKHQCSDVVQKLRNEKFPQFKYVSYYETSFSSSSKDLNKWRSRCGEKLCSKDSEASLSDECMTVSQRQRMRETQRLLKGEQKETVKKHEKYYFSSSKESLAQTLSNTKLQRMQKDIIEQHTSQKEKSKRAPSIGTLRFNSSSCFLPVEPTLRCSSREVKMPDQTFSKGSYSENVLSKSKPEERQTDLFDDEKDQNTRSLAETCRPHLKEITSEKGQTDVEDTFGFTYSDTVKTMLSDDKGHVRAEGDVIVTTRMKSKMPGESNYRVLKGTTSDHLEENPFPLLAGENEQRLVNKDNVRLCEGLSDKQFGVEIKDIIFMKTINPSEDSL